MRALFPGQNIDEKIYLAVREHPIILGLKLLAWFMFVVVLFAFKRYAPEFTPVLFEGQTGVIISLIQQLYGLFLALSLFIIFILYYLNLHVVTEIRIVDIAQQGLFRHTVATLNINQIEDVTSDTAGILGTLFDFGTIYIQTAGARERFQMDDVPHPAQLSKIIIDLFEEQQKKNPKND